MTKTILVTGGAGFIGQSFVEYALKETDFNLVVLDSLSYAADTNRLCHLDGYDTDRVTLLWHDLRAPINEYLAGRIGPVDYIVNIASESHVERSIADPAAFFMNNCALAVNMLEYARVAKPEIFIQVSTDEVYGPAKAGVEHKEWEPHIPSNPYAASKSAQEALAISYWRTFGVPVVITNTMNNFGEHQHSEKFIPLTVGNIVRGEPTVVHGVYKDGEFESGSRFWLHSTNHADALLYILTQLEPNQYPTHDRPSRWNVVGDIEVSNLDIVKKASDYLKKPAILDLVDFHSSRPGHDLRYGLDGSALAQAGWEPLMTFDESFRSTVERSAASLLSKGA